MRLYFLALVCLLVGAGTEGYRGPFRRLLPDPPVTPVHLNDDPGEPLFLTPYLEQGKVDEARRLR